MSIKSPPSFQENEKRIYKEKNKGMKGRAPPSDLLSCFPSTARRALMPSKPMRSPSRPSQPTKRAQPSPFFRSKSGGAAATIAADDGVIDEPTSPTVTCAGQIKVRPAAGKPATSAASDGKKDWMSVVAEMEKLHRSTKKPFTHFLCALRRKLRFDLSCFGSFHGAADCFTDDDGADNAEEEEEEEAKGKILDRCASTTIFSNWFMVLENQSHELKEEETEKVFNEEEERREEMAPPPNALLLMRCRSAPTKGGRFVTEEDDEEKIDKEKEKEKEKERFLMSYEPDFTRLSTEIAKETWVVGKFEPLARSRSWRS